MSYKIRQNPSPFFTAGRPQGIQGLVLHHGATTDFNGIGITFKTAGVSAGYGVAPRKIDQYVADSNIAYHAGDWDANEKYIGIEHVNKSGSPWWAVDQKTLDTSVELAIDLVRRHKLGKLVPFKNLFPHGYFTPTFCPGHIKEKLQWYADAVNKGKSSAPAAVAKPSKRRSEADIAQEVVNGKWGNNPQRAAALKAAGYNPSRIQALVNAHYSKPSAPKKSISQVAREVIAGSWGVNPARKANLERAGHNYAKVQAEVNKQLGIGKTVASGGIIAVGQNVQFKSPVGYNGTRLGVSGTYKVMEVRGDRAVVGRGGQVTAAVKTTNLKRV